MSADTDAVAAALPDYEIIREIGRGQFGVVYAGRHRQLQRDVAVKQLAGSASEEYRARFRREARILAQIDHPHVVHVYDYREEDDLRLLVMELLPGGTLRDRRASMTDEELIDAVGAAASGLQHVHDQGVLHRDVTPDNLMFDRHGALKVTDFGVARGDLVDATVINVTHAGEFFGTPAYAAPEQAAPALGEAGAPVGPAADQYSLAAVLYEALSGQLTHDPSGGAVALCRRRAHEDARPLRAVAPEVPPALAAVVMRALSRDPEDRYATTGEFGAALAGARAEREPVRPRRIAPLLVGLVTVILIALVVGILIANGGDSNSGSTANSTPATSASAPVELTKEWSTATGGPVYSSPAVADDLVVVGSNDNSVHAFSVRDGEQQWAHATDAVVRSSPTIENGRVYVGSYDGNVYALDLASGDEVWKAPTVNKIESAPAVANGLVVVGSDKLYAFEADTGRERWSAPVQGAIIAAPEISDGVVVVGTDKGVVYGFGLDGRERWHRPLAGAVEAAAVIADGTAYVPGNDGSLYAFDVATGDNWVAPLGAPARRAGAVAGDHVFIGTDAGKLLALDNRNRGEQLWSWTAPESIRSTPLILDNLVVVGCDDGKVYVVDRATGALRATFTTGGAVESSPAAGGNGAVVFGSVDESVYSVTGLDSVR